MSSSTIRGSLILRNVPQRLRDEIVDAFTYDNPAYASALKFSPWGKISDQIPKQICLVREKGKCLFVPRGFDPEIQLSDKGEKLFKPYLTPKDRRQKFNVKFPGLHITPNKEQRRLLESFDSALRSNARPYGAYLFIAPTSAGKTIFQALCARRAGQRTLVICHTNLIRDAWYKDLYTAFGIAKKDVGLIQQSKWVIGDVFTLATAATLDRRVERWSELFDNIGCVIVDEVHKTEPRLVRFLRKCPAKYIIGATATDKPEEGSNFYLEALFGNPVKRLISTQRDTESSMSLKRVELVYTKFKYKADRHNLDQHDLSLALSADEDRNDLIVENAVQDWREGHSVLIVVKRTAHLHLLHEMLKERGVADANVLYGGTNTKKRYTEALIKAVVNRNVRMLVATIPAIKLGANLNPLDRLHMAWPANRADLEQLIGRIRRRSAGKEDTVLKYYVDVKCGYLHRRFSMKAIPVFRKLRVPGYENIYVA